MPVFFSRSTIFSEIRMFHSAWRQWFNRQMRSLKPHNGSGSRCNAIRGRFRPRLEYLEDRLAPAVLPPAGLVSWYRAEGNASDFAGSNNGTLQGGATFTTGEVGQAFSLNGTDAFVEIPDSPSLSITGAITLEAWINPNSVTGVHEINSKYDSSINQESWALLVMDGVVRAEFLGSGNGFIARI